MASPACTELEVVTMNWLGKLLGLPEEFLNCSSGPGGGVIQVMFFLKGILRRLKFAFHEVFLRIFFCDARSNARSVLIER